VSAFNYSTRKNLDFRTYRLGDLAVGHGHQGRRAAHDGDFTLLRRRHGGNAGVSGNSAELPIGVVAKRSRSSSISSTTDLRAMFNHTAAPRSVSLPGTGCRGLFFTIALDCVPALVSGNCAPPRS
jgi:hypothetical protein